MILWILVLIVLSFYDDDNLFDAFEGSPSNRLHLTDYALSLSKGV